MQMVSILLGPFMNTTASVLLVFSVREFAVQKLNAAFEKAQMSFACADVPRSSPEMRRLAQRWFRSIVYGKTDRCFTPWFTGKHF